ncbi:SpoIIE family protein phosphatase, partial [Streptomyces sp. NPDC048581]|uniref:SpoIIE family protein phosphatase n=1 Tax=Streptomyces sp. NPDC048581 TaxID=3365572 RepID=UPI00371BDB6A
MVDANGLIVKWSDAAERLLGYPAREVLNRRAVTLIVPRTDPTGRTAASGLRLTDTVWGGYTVVRHRDGRHLSLVVQVCPQTDPTGRLSWLVHAFDVVQSPWWGVNNSVMEGLLARAPVGITVLDTDLRCLWLNDAMVETVGIPREQRMGQRLSAVFPGPDAAALEAQIRQVLASGTPLIDRQYLGPTVADPHGQRAYSASFFRLEDPSGQVRGVSCLVLDVTERWQAHERLVLMNEIGERIGGTLDVMRTAQEVADAAVPFLADFVSIDLLESIAHGEEPDSRRAGGSTTLRRAGQRSVHEGCPESSSDTGDLVTYAPSSPTAQALTARQATLECVLNVDTSAWVAESADRAHRIRACGIHSLMIVPMAVENARLGVATFVRSRHQRPFDEDDLLFAKEFVARSALSLDTARRFESERTTALALQRSLLPRRPEGRSVLDVAWRYLPAGSHSGVGGDWFDVIPLSGARMALVVGDVVGHGIHAAATMGRLRTAVHTLAAMDLPPEELLAHLDDLVMRLAQEEAEDAEDTKADSTALGPSGATCLYAVYDPVARSLTAASAGHPPPVSVTPDGTAAFLDLPAGPPLGVGTLPFECTEADLPEGSILALYTDGLVTGHDQDIGTGMDRLAGALADPATALEELCGNVFESLLTMPLCDDAALLVAQTHTLGPEQVASWDLPAEPAIVAQTRALVGRRLTEWQLDDLSFTTELLVSELVTNAIRYGAEPIRLRLIRHDVLICEVSDGSSTSPRLRHARTTERFQLGHRPGDAGGVRNARGSRAVGGGVRSL